MNWVTSDFYCERDENCVLMGYHSSCSVNNWLFSSQFVTVMLCIPCRFTP